MIHRMTARPHVGRLTVSFGLAVALATLISGMLVFAVARQQMRAEVDEWLAGDAAILLPRGAATTPAQALARLDEWERGHSFSEKGHVLYDAGGRIVSPGQIVMARPRPGYSEVRFRDGNRTRDGRALAVSLRGGAMLVVIAHSEIGAATSEMLLPALIATVLAAGLAGLAGSWFFGRGIAVRIVRIQAAADTIARGNLSHRLPVDQFDGIFAEQALSLNRMLARLEDMVRSHRQFASHLAHDLRTPLTRLRVLLGECLDLPRDELARAIDRADRECGTIIATFDALLRLSEIEAGRHPAGFALLDLRAVIEDVAETMEPVLADAGSTLELGQLEPAQVSADNALMHQLFVNLLENVVLHTPPGTHARLSLARQDSTGAAVVTLTDDGPGIGAESRDRVIEPFARGAGAPEGKGHGLGLAIAQAIMRFHGGGLELGDAGPGLRIDLRLPLVSAPA